MKQSLFLILMFSFSTIVQAGMSPEAIDERIENYYIVSEVSALLESSNPKCAATTFRNEAYGGLLISVFGFKNNSKDCMRVRYSLIVNAKSNHYRSRFNQMDFEQYIMNNKKVTGAQ